jgi:hypothetical protein
MKSRGPVLTLLAVLAVGVGVFTVNTVLAAPADTTPVVQAAAQQADPYGSAPAADPYAASDGYGAAPQAAPETAAPETAAPETADPETAAPQAAQAAVTGTFAGRSAGNEVTLAVGMDGDRVVAYVCDGKKIESWLQGSANGASLQLTGADGELDATVTENAVLGTVSVGEKSWPFAAQLKKSAGTPTDRATLSELGSA